MKKITRTAGMVAALMVAVGTSAYAGNQSVQAVAISEMNTISDKASVRGEGTWEALVDIIMDVLSVGEEQVKMDAIFKDDLGADSLDMGNIIMECEDRFVIAISNEAAESIKTVANLYDLIIILGILQ